MSFRIVSTERMRAIEAAADASGITYEQLMQNAGRAAANRALAYLEGMTDAKVTILIGSGNNGGDGLVCGLFIAQDKPDVLVRFYLLQARAEDDPHVKIVREAGLFIANAEDDGDKRVLRNMVASSDLVVDALFGIGVRLPLRDEAAKILRAVNQAIHERANSRPEQISLNPAQPHPLPRAPKIRVLAVDCPSGLDCDTGAIDKNAVAADETITFIAVKPGLFTFPGAAAVGALTIADCGIPANFKELMGEKDSVVDAETVRALLPERSLDGNKGTFGKALIAGGSVNYTGAPALSAAAAYRSGVGLVSVAAPRPVAAVLAPEMLETTWLMLPHDMGVIAEGAASVLTEEMSKYTALLIGPGIGQDKATKGFLLTLLQTTHTNAAAHVKRALGFGTREAQAAEKSEGTLKLPPLVLDADALNILAAKSEWWTLLPPDTIITPHPGEMGRLAGLETAEIQANRMTIAREKAIAWKVILVLKGAHTVIATPDGKLAVLPFKNDALATAGTGDVLAGLIVGLLAQGLQPNDAAVVGAYLHGLAGEIAASRHGSRSVIAGDVITALSAAFQAV